MKLTKEQLKQIINQEYKKIQEDYDNPHAGILNRYRRNLKQVHPDITPGELPPEELPEPESEPDDKKRSFIQKLKSLMTGGGFKESITEEEFESMIDEELSQLMSELKGHQA